MKIILAAILIALLLGFNLAQEVSIEKDFERERRSLSLDRFNVGEDASSGSYYLVYKSRSRIKKIRSVWNGGCCEAPTVEDIYFKNGSPVLYVKLAVEKKLLDAVIKGSNTSLRPIEKLYLKNSKLTTWIENGETIPSSDSRWKDREKTVLEHVKGQLETYKDYREGNL